VVFQVEKVDAHVGEVAELGQDLGDELTGGAHPFDLCGRLQLDHRCPHPSLRWYFNTNAAGMSPETLRKIETGGSLPLAFGTIACLSEVLDLPIQDLAAAWRNAPRRLEAAS
jgi:hypothetical protein